MSLISFPEAPVPASIDWKVNQPTQANRSEFSKKRRVTILAAAPRLHARVTLPRILGEENVFEWRAFVVDCDGKANRFKLIACERDQLTGVAPVVAGAGQAGRTLQTSGWGTPGLKLKRGQFFTVDEQLLILMQNVVADENGNATLRFKPYLRVVPANGASLEVKRPYAVMSMSSDDTGWLADVGQEYGVSFDCEESF